MTNTKAVPRCGRCGHTNRASRIDDWPFWLERRIRRLLRLAPPPLYLHECRHEDFSSWGVECECADPFHGG